MNEQTSSLSPTLLNEADQNTNNFLLSDILDNIFRPIKSQVRNLLVFILANIFTIRDLLPCTIDDM